MRALRIGFLFQAALTRGLCEHLPEGDARRSPRPAWWSMSLPCNERLIDLSTVRVEHDLYVLRQISGVSMSLAGALHAQGAAIVNPYPVTVALRDR